MPPRRTWLGPFTALIVLAPCSPPVAAAEPPARLGAASVIADGYVRAFMLESSPGRVVLVDSASDQAGKPILRELGRRGLPASAVEAILLTHGHADHTSGCLAFPGARIVALENEVDLIEGRKEAAAPISWTPLGWYLARTRAHVHVTDPLRDGQSITLGTLKVTAFAVPGHSEGSAVYQIGDLLFLGDVASAKSRDTLEPPPWFFSDDVERDCRSVRALATRLAPQAATFKWLIPSHSDPLAGFAPLANF